VSPDGKASPEPSIDAGRVRLRRLVTAELSVDELQAIRALLDAAFGDDEDGRFTDDDWQHSIGGMHFVLDVDGRLVAHASVVEREIHVDGWPLRTGYVEAVATAPGYQGAGFGSIVIADVTAVVRERYEFGVLGTGRHHFYERLGWLTWEGPLFVRTADGSRRTPEDEGFLLVLRTPTTPPIDIHAPISCDWRPGDVW
jgi:Acetyltransferase (GNAT) family.